MKTNRANSNGVITVLFENRLVDRIAREMAVIGLYQITDYRPIINGINHEEVGRFLSITGGRSIIWFLQKLTQIRGKNVKEVIISTDMNGNILDVK